MSVTKIALDDEQVKTIEAEVDEHFTTESHVSENLAAAYDRSPS
jgi:hypothetical protein